MKSLNNMLLSNFVKVKLYFEDVKSGQKGLGTVEVILITFVLVSLVIVFRKSITDLVDKYLKKIDPKW